MKYFIEGKEAEKGEALAHWLSSKSYDLARRSTRTGIWVHAQQADGGPFNEIGWLNEAGITIEQ